jgi:hypothetical protein
VGQLSYDDWVDSCAEDKESEHRIGALRNFRKALQSGSVTAFRHRFDGRETLLTPIDAAGEFFEIDLERDGVILSGLPEFLFECRVSAEQLKAFMRKFEPRAAMPSIKAEADFKKWLTSEVNSKREIPARGPLWEWARRRFALGKNSYNRVRAEVARELDYKWPVGAPKKDRTRNRTEPPK